MARTPNLFFVGAAKSGTTAMDSYLREHPDIFMAEKEPHFFSQELNTPRAKHMTLARYEQFFEAAGDEMVVGECSVFYLFSKAAPAAIHDYAPDAKILIQIRNPVEVIPSHHSQLLFVENEDEPDLARALALEPERRAGRSLPANAYLREVWKYREFVTFSEQIERYFDAFGRERVHIVLYDDFRRDTAGAYRDVLRFLEVDPDFEPEFPVVNANKRMRSRFLMDMVVRDPPAWANRLSRMFFGLETRNRIKSLVERANTRYVPRDPIDPALEAQLKTELRPEIDRLGALLGRDLTHWCAVREARVA